jgi:hypothetical protein
VKWERRRVKVTVYLPASVVARLRADARVAGVSQSVVVAGALAAGAASIPAGRTQAVKRARAMRRQGRTLQEIATELNVRGVRTARGRPWNVVSVSRLIATGHRGGIH